MKKTVKAGVLTGLILAPAAVVSANETDVMNDGAQIEPIAAVETEAVVVPYNAVAALDIEKERIEELFKLDGKTTISNFNTYQELVNRFFPQATFSAENTLLTAKLTFLKELQDLKARSVSLTNEISLLKTAHPQLFTTVPDLVKERAAIAQSFEEIRKKLDDVVLNTSTYSTEGNSNYPFITDFDSQAMQAVDSYLKTIQGFEGEFLKNAATLDTYAQDIIKANAFVYGGDIKTTNTSGDTITITIPAFVEDIADSTTLQDETQAQVFMELLNEANQFYNEKMTANEKKIADSHVLKDDRTVAAVMKQANDDLTKANKVAELITGIQSVTAKDYKSKVGKIVSEYEKLNVRAKMLVLEYGTKVDNRPDKSGYKDGLDFIELVDALKPNATDEYRTALGEAEAAYIALATNLQDLLESYNNELIAHRAVVTAAEGVEALIEGLGINPNVEAKDIEAARKAYDALTSTQKKIVNNYKELQAWEKSGKTTIKLNDQIEAVVIENKKTFASKVDKLNESYEKLSAGEQALVTMSPRLVYLTPFATATGSFYSLKTTSANYKTDVSTLLTTLTGLNTNNVTDSDDITALKKLRDELLASVQKLESQLTNADGVITLINTANGTFTNNNDQLLAIQAARTAYNALPKEEQKLVTNLKTLTELEKAIKQPVAVIKAIEAVDPGNAKKFPSAAKSAVSAFEKLTTTQKSYLSDDYQKRIEDFKTYLAFVDQMKALKPTAAGFQEAYAAAKAKYDQLIKPGAWQSTLKDDIAEAVEMYEPTLNGHNTSITGGLSVYKMIEELSGKYGKDFLDTITKIDAAYAALSADAKKQVTNYKQFQQLKKDGTVALKVVDLINDDAITSVNVADSGYVKKVESAVKAFDKLTSSQKAHVYNSAYLERNLPIYEIVKAINNLKPSAKTYIEDIANVRQMYNRLTPANQRYLEPILYKIEGAETGLVTVNEVMDLIDAARPGVEDYVQKLTAAREAYDKLARINSGYQKLVLNYKTLTEREKALKPVTTAIYQIKELEEILARPVIDSNELVKKYNNAVKAYEKIPYESRELVYNREVLLATLYPVAKTMEAIANIKPSSKTFAEDVKKARDWYNSLSPADQARVSNYNDLLAFENTVSGGSDVDGLIRQISSTPPTQYMQAIKEARAAYDALTANEKRAVTLYKELQNYEKGVKNVQATIDAIDNLQYASNLVSAYDKATKALDKLTAEQRQMVPNMDKLRNVGPAIDVYKMIASLKPSNANYAGTVQAAYSAYNMLSSTEKQYVTNFATLQEAKNNVDSVQTVISKISSISPTSRNYAEQVAEALAMYNSLPSAVRKLVTNYDALKSSQKEADTVDKVRQLISEINPNASNFESKLKSARSAYDKLTTQQKRLVSNYFLLEDYEAQLSNSSFFF
ncbi:MAG: hypothetical protein ACI33M_08260 [Lysinibacillus sp.]